MYNFLLTLSYKTLLYIQVCTYASKQSTNPYSNTTEIIGSKHLYDDRKSTSQWYNYQYSQQLVSNKYLELLSLNQHSNNTDPSEIIQFRLTIIK